MSDLPAFARSAAYSLAFVPWAFFASLACYVIAVMRGRSALLTRAGMLWQQGNAFLEKHILGLTCSLEGKENLPPNGAFIVAMQHQSAWETMKLLLWFRDPAIVLKAELLEIPMWGKAMRIFGAIPVARSRKAQDLKNMLHAAEEAAAQKRPIIIFPHGTRMKPGIKKALQGGVGVLYEHLTLPVVPVSLNSGEFWGRKAFLHQAGRIRVVIHPPILPGLPRDELMKQLDAFINTPVR